ncbi:hypothetical protein [Patulibacter defluvii]|uniref:hypothetical protein n=1 Tax=Patulibacter defluvii TaxID=3095358 RepID=UPI002A74D7B4|nr:hypothetical protein [Patulibacter sp. DM4]
MSTPREIRAALVRAITETIDDCRVFDGPPAGDQPPFEAVWIERKHSATFEPRALGGQPWGREQHLRFHVKVAAYREAPSHDVAHAAASERVDDLVHRIEWDAIGRNQTLFDTCTDAYVVETDTDDVAEPSGWEVHCDLTVAVRQLPSIPGL